jgi:hypothetical protein
MKQLRECFTIDGYINKIGIDFQLESCAQILLLRAGITCYTVLPLFFPPSASSVTTTKETNLTYCTV